MESGSWFLSNSIQQQKLERILILKSTNELETTVILQSEVLYVTYWLVNSTIIK